MGDRVIKSIIFLCEICQQMTNLLESRLKQLTFMDLFVMDMTSQNLSTGKLTLKYKCFFCQEFYFHQWVNINMGDCIET